MAFETTNSFPISDNNTGPVMYNRNFYQFWPDLTQQFCNPFAITLEFQKSLLNAEIETWNAVVQIQIDAVINIYQHIMEQSLTTRECLGVTIEDQMKRLQEITTFEQTLALDAIEILCAQTGAAHVQMIRVWDSTSNLYHK